MRYLAQRLLQFVLVFAVVTFVVLAATRIGSADPARDLAGGVVTDAQVEAVKEEYPYLDDPLVVQWAYWTKDFVTGDWGRSYLQGQTVVDMFQQRMPTTAFIAFWAIVIGLVIAVPVGVYAAYRRDRVFDRATSLGSFAVISTPPLVIAVALLFLVVTRTELFPTVGSSQYVAPWDNPVEHFKNFFIPSLSLGLGLSAVWGRLLRADMILALQSDSILMARSKGISTSRLLWVHALRASALSLMTSVALQMSALLGGAVVAETFFGPKGIGDRLIVAIQQNDLLVIQAIAAVITVAVVVFNIGVDLLYAVVDPRIRAARSLA